MKIWLISGAYSGVGKTWLARALASSLPKSVTVKIGHHEPGIGKPGNYFTSTEEAMEFIKAQAVKKSHCIVESNRLVEKIKADVVCFLDHIDDNRRSDAGRLRRAAQVIIGHKGNPSEWEELLSGIDLTPAIKEKILEAFRVQHQYLQGNRLTLRTKIWFARDRKVVFGEGLARLLSGIEKHGSLSAAARAEGISYRHAWGDIKRAEERLGIKLLERSVGGVSGGGALLTGKARKLLAGYEGLRRRTVKLSDRWFRNLLDELSE